MLTKLKTKMNGEETGLFVVKRCDKRRRITVVYHNIYIVGIGFNEAETNCGIICTHSRHPTEEHRYIS